ncbi:MAG: CopG family ribbon-helix-helix protein [Candidatus Verstraetearchaeota archaeon]|nr:CopG family ribbon-helix-helix protein [Candidatus Verstraetearchaeota archaeon]
MVVISLSIPDDLLAELDKLLGREWCASRSEVLRQALRKYISEYRGIESLKGRVVATLTVLYQKNEKGEEQLRLQHEFGDIISAFFHFHVNEDACLEVIVVRGEAQRLRGLIDGLKANRSVRQINLSLMDVRE